MELLKWPFFRCCECHEVREGFGRRGGGGWGGYFSTTRVLGRFFFVFQDLYASMMESIQYILVTIRSCVFELGWTA